MAKPRQKITAKPPRPARVHARIVGESTADLKTRAAALNAERRVRRGVTVESATADLELARLLAHEQGNAQAAVDACMGMAKLHGLVIDRSRVETITTAAMTEEQIDEALQRRKIEGVRRDGRDYIADQIAALENLLALYDAGQFEEYAKQGAPLPRIDGGPR